MRVIISALLVVVLAGCATIFSGTSQTINVKIVDAANQQLLTNASCSVVDDSGPISSITSNPAAITVSRSNGAIHINCKRSGYRQLNMAVGDSFNAVTVVNVLFWPGFIVDAVSGAYKKYPSHYVINMEKTK